MKRLFCGCMALLLCLLLLPLSALADEKESGNEDMPLTKEQYKSIESFVKKQMKDGRIPGISLVIVNGDKEVYKKGFGYSNLKKKETVTPETLFELGSASKAFTALGILQLEEKGFLDLNDPVKKYLPWFELTYRKESQDTSENKVNINLKHFFYQTSGIPYNTIGSIPAVSGDDSLELTVNAIMHKELDFHPGEKFSYATINYDVLGLIIKNITNQSFENYMRKEVLDKLGLSDTYLFRDEALKQGMATGYKLNFLKPVEYNAPVYRGNTPAGYFISNGNDMEKWLKIQMGMNSGIGFSKVIDKSHIPDRSVAPGADGASYAGGWFVYQKGSGEISHGGSNPNFSSFIVQRPEENLGVAVLANMNSSYTQVIGQGVIDILKGEKPQSAPDDLYMSIDNFSFVVVCITVALILITLFFLIVLFVQLVKKERTLKKAGAVECIVSCSTLIIFLFGLGLCLYRIPDVLFFGLNWDFVKVWAPSTFITAVVLTFTSMSLFGIYYFLRNLFPKKNETSLFSMIILSLVSGFGNALIIFIINEALNDNGDGFRSKLALFFVMGIVLYIFGQRLVRIQIISLANGMVYQKRVELINKISKASFQSLEEIEQEKIYACLNNDTETISNFANNIISGVTGLITLVCCFVYLGVIDLKALLVSIFLIIIAAGLYFMASKSAGKLWEETRDIQNVFYRFINDLLNGFKELSINRKKFNEFKNEMTESCDLYRKKQVFGSLKFANVFIIGELVFTFVIGMVVFIFPIVFPDIQNSSLESYVFVFLYMTGPVHGVLNSIPNFIHVRISWNRLKILGKQLDSLTRKCESEGIETIGDKDIRLELRDVKYEYMNKDGEAFSVGPIDYIFRSGEIVFITGGNGSGKSTLAKLITGLYNPKSGDILLNGKKAGPDELGQKFSTVFCDFHLFDRLYGIDYKEKEMEIEKYLKILHIDNKLKINEGVFSTTSLSTGQRRRLALLVCYLEDCPVFLFDEWAADQDPGFKKFFYCVLLPELKERGKCVIVITHDDRYFDMADRVIKMETGRIILSEEKATLSESAVALS